MIHMTTLWNFLCLWRRVFSGISGNMMICWLCSQLAALVSWLSFLNPCQDRKIASGRLFTTLWHWTMRKLRSLLMQQPLQGQISIWQVLEIWWLLAWKHQPWKSGAVRLAGGVLHSWSWHTCLGASKSTNALLPLADSPFGPDKFVVPSA